MVANQVSPPRDARYRRNNQFNTLQNASDTQLIKIEQREKQRFDRELDDRATQPDLADYSTRAIYGMFGFGSKENPLSLKNMKHQKKRLNEELSNLPGIETSRLLGNQVKVRKADRYRNNISFPTIGSTALSPPETI